MMKLSMTLRAFPALTLAAVLGATPLQAETSPGDAEAGAATGTTEVRVVNNHQGRVAVYAIGDGDTRQYLGTVSRSGFKAFELPAGAIRLQVVPRSAPAGLGVRESQESGIQTRAVDAKDGQTLQLWLEPQLKESTAMLYIA